jgi:hypothetical protein
MGKHHGKNHLLAGKHHADWLCAVRPYRIEVVLVRNK